MLIDFLDKFNLFASFPLAMAQYFLLVYEMNQKTPIINK